MTITTQLAHYSYGYEANETNRTDWKLCVDIFTSAFNFTAELIVRYAVAVVTAIVVCTRLDGLLYFNYCHMSWQ